MTHIFIATRRKNEWSTTLWLVSSRWKTKSIHLEVGNIYLGIQPDVQLQIYDVNSVSEMKPSNSSTFYGLWSYGIPWPCGDLFGDTFYTFCNVWMIQIHTVQYWWKLVDHESWNCLIPRWQWNRNATSHSPWYNQ